MDEGSLSDTQRTMVLPLLQETNIHGKPYITVSAKGIVNGLSRYPNDGADFGPDTTLGATAPGQYGGTYTTSGGITEAFNYSESTAFYDTQYTGQYEYPRIVLGTGIFYISAAQTITTTKAAHSIIISGQGQNNTRLVAQSSVGNSNYVFTLDLAGSPILQINDMSWYFESNTSQGMFDWEPNSTDNTAAGLNLFNIENGAGSQKYLAYFGGSGLQNAYVQNIQNEGNTPLYIGATSATMIEGGWTNANGGIFEIGGSGAVYVAHSSSAKINGDAYLITAIDSNLTIDAISSSSVVNVIGSRSSVVLNTDLSFLNIYGSLTYGTSIVSSGSSTVYNVGRLTIKSGNNTGGSADVLSNVTASAVYIENINGYTNIPYNSPTISANPPVSGTVYQNTNPYDIEIDLPVYATTAGTAGYVTVAKGSTSTPAAIGNQYVSGDTSSTSVDIIRLRVPANWYYEFTASGVTFGTASVFAE